MEGIEQTIPGGSLILRLNSLQDLKNAIKPEIGVKVVHSKFGQGTVRKVDTSNIGLYVMIDFEDESKSWLSQRDYYRMCKMVA